MHDTAKLKLDAIDAMKRELATVRTPADAILGFVRDLDRINGQYGQGDRRGYEAALASVGVLCGLLGRPDLVSRFRELGEGLSDLREGRPAPAFLRPVGTPSGGKTTAEWIVAAEACAHLVVLRDDLGMPEREAARALNRIMTNRGVTVRRSYNRQGKPLSEEADWQGLVNQLGNIRAGHTNPEVRDRFEIFLSGLRDDLALIHEPYRKDELLKAFDDLIRQSGVGKSRK